MRRKAKPPARRHLRGWSVNLGRFRVELLFLVAGLALGVGCNNTLFDAAGVPAAGALVCAAPATHACEAIRLCKADDDASFCEASCRRCETAVAGAKAICSANRCTYECPAGLLKCANGCCAAKAVSAGGDHACAIADPTGELLCWGANNDGQLGIGYDPSLPVPPETGVDQATPVKVPLPANLKAVAVGAGGAHSCAVLDSGAVWCWGRKSSYAGGKDYDFAPTEVAGLAGAIAVASGGAHSCFITAGGAVRCVGSWDPVGAITNGLPVASGATALAAGDDFTCAIAESAPGAGDGTVRCWGANDHAQLGATGTVAQPVAVLLGPPVVAIGAGVHHTCASTPAGPLRCWSAKRVGTAPPGTPDPYQPDGVDFAATAISGGQMHACAVASGAADGAECWGADLVPPVVVGGAPPAVGARVHVALPAPVLALASGDFHTCALEADGRVACWGRGARGQLGDNRKVDSAAPVFVISR